MKKIWLLVLCAALAAAPLTGCVSVNFSNAALFAEETGRGTPEGFEFTVGAYSAVRVEGYCDVRYYAGTSDTVTLKIQPNLLEYYEVEVVGGELVLRTTRRINFSAANTPVLTVYTPVLEGLTVTGAGKFTAHDVIAADSFTLRLSGAGDVSAGLDVGRLSVSVSGAGSIELAGTADTAELTMSGAGNLDAFQLQTRETSVRLSGAGAVRVYCTETLRIDASGIGAVEYKGGASVDINRGGLVVVERVD
ncbi:MAG: DUF2807 domain-containing protein [Oscillospiraceae bacterium]|nr:DUF2807 domain-containing protein [Oscillospiraceae bacterium]